MNVITMDFGLDISLFLNKIYKNDELNIQVFHSVVNTGYWLPQI